MPQATQLMRAPLGRSGSHPGWVCCEPQVPTRIGVRVEGDLESPGGRPAKGPFPYCQPLGDSRAPSERQTEDSGVGGVLVNDSIPLWLPLEGLLGAQDAGGPWRGLWSGGVPLTSTAVICGTLPRLHSLSLGDLVCPLSPRPASVPWACLVFWGHEVVGREQTGVTLLC